MISIRCYLTITSACVTPGHLIIDPFAGSGAILKMGSCFGAITMSSDVDSICCTHSALNKVRAKLRTVLCFTYLQHLVIKAVLWNITEEIKILKNILSKNVLRLFQSTKGNCVLSDMRNSPWVGMYDAIVTDPPYNIRTHLLKEYNAETSDPLIPHGESSCSHSLQHSFQFYFHVRNIM